MPALTGDRQVEPPHAVAQHFWPPGHRKSVAHRLAHTPKAAVGGQSPGFPEPSAIRRQIELGVKEEKKRVYTSKVKSCEIRAFEWASVASIFWE